MAVTANDSVRLATAITSLHERHVRLAMSEGLGRYAGPLLDLLTDQPVVTVKYVVERIGGTPTTIGGLLDRLVALDVLREVTGQRRNRVYRYSPYLDLFASDDPSLEHSVQGGEGR